MRVREREREGGKEKALCSLIRFVTRKGTHCKTQEKELKGGKCFFERGGGGESFQNPNNERDAIFHKCTGGCLYVFVKTRKEKQFLQLNFCIFKINNIASCILRFFKEDVSVVRNKS